MNIQNILTIKKPRRWYWKLYGWGLLIFFLASSFNPSAYGWGLYLPLAIGVLLFAYNKAPRFLALWKFIFWFNIFLFISPTVWPLLYSFSEIGVFIVVFKGLLNIILMSPSIIALWNFVYKDKVNESIKNA